MAERGWRMFSLEVLPSARARSNLPGADHSQDCAKGKSRQRAHREVLSRGSDIQPRGIQMEEGLVNQYLNGSSVRIFGALK